MYDTLFFYSSVDGHLGFHFLAMNVCVQVFVWMYVFGMYLGYVPRDGIGESYGKSMVSILSNFQMVAQFYIPTSSA